MYQHGYLYLSSPSSYTNYAEAGASFLDINSLQDSKNKILLKIAVLMKLKRTWG